MAQPALLARFHAVEMQVEHRPLFGGQEGVLDARDLPWSPLSLTTKHREYLCPFACLLLLRLIAATLETCRLSQTSVQLDREVHCNFQGRRTSEGC